MATQKPAKPGKPTAPKTKPAPAAPAATKEKEPKAPKPPKEPKVKIERESANGVTRPKADSQTGKVWQIADDISAKKKAPATRAEVMEVATAEPHNINEATVATQYQRWRTFFGIERQAPAPKPEKPTKEPKAPKPPKTPAK